MWALVIDFVGCPGILGSLLISAIGILLRRPSLLVVGAILSTGFAWIYLPSWRMFRGLAYLLPFLHLGAAFALQHQRRWLSWIALLPQTAIAIYLGSMVMSQHPGA